MSAADIVRSMCEEATQAHGRFSQWNGSESLTVTLHELRLALDGDTAAKARIALVLDRAKATQAFTSWAGNNGHGVVALTVAELRAFITT